MHFRYGATGGAGCAGGDGGAGGCGGVPQELTYIAAINSNANIFFMISLFA